MVFLWIGLSVVVVLFVWAALTDVRALRRGVRYTGVDGKARLEHVRKVDTDLNVRDRRGIGRTGGGSPF
jgi:hypothetical protein